MSVCVTHTQHLSSSPQLNQRRRRIENKLLRIPCLLFSIVYVLSFKRFEREEIDITTNIKRDKTKNQKKKKKNNNNNKKKKKKKKNILYLKKNL